MEKIENIELAKSAVKFLESLQTAQPKVAKQIENKISELKNNPFPHTVKKLKGTKREYFRIKSGEYRIIYFLSDDRKTLFINTIGKRNDGEVYNFLITFLTPSE